MWVNAAGEKFWVKYHFKTDQGVECLTAEEAAAMVSEDPDFHRRANYLQLPVNQPKVPVNQPKVPVHTYTFDGARRHEHTGAQPVYSPNSYGGPVADPVRGEDHGWHADGAGRLVGNVVGHLSAGVSRPVLERAVAYWRSVDKAVGDRIATAWDSTRQPDDPSLGPSPGQHFQGKCWPRGRQGGTFRENAAGRVGESPYRK